MLDPALINRKQVFLGEAALLYVVREVASLEIFTVVNNL